MQRNLSPTDRFLASLNRGLSTWANRADGSARANPAAARSENPLDDDSRRHIAGLMRINHAGEVAAQALYHGQALVARDPELREHLLAAASEERDHLRWCEERLQELGEHPSRLEPVWYAGSLAIGAVAALAGDRWSLGFVDETERQVAEHLGEHLQQIPPEDQRSRAILEQMRSDEERHGAEARAAGASELPSPVKTLMRQVARVMKFGAYRI